jgi:adenylate cyclase
MDYAVIGDVVNTAARLEALCKPLGEVLLLSDVVAAELVDPALRARLTPRGAHHVKGREQEVQVHTLTGLAPEPSALPSPVHAA